MKKRNRR